MVFFQSIFYRFHTLAKLILFVLCLFMNHLVNCMLLLGTLQAIYWLTDLIRSLSSVFPPYLKLGSNYRPHLSAVQKALRLLQ